MVYTYNYNTAYSGPAMPVVPLEIGNNTKTEKWFTVQALVNSGADATMIPIRYLRQLGVEPVNKRRVVDASGISYSVEVYVVALRVGPYYHPAVGILANRQSKDVLLGRNVLNHLIVTLNGLAYTVEISD